MSLRGGRKPDAAISGRQLRIRRRPSHVTAASCEIATAPAEPRNDKLGSAFFPCHCEEGASPTWRPERAARGSALGVQSRRTRPHRGKAIGENATAFPRLPRRFAPRNDTSGSAVVYQRPPTVELPCTGRSLRSRWRLCRLTDAACPLRVMSALQGGNTYGTNSLAQCHQVCHCEEAAGRRGNLAVPEWITGKPRRKRNCLPEIAPQGHFLALRAQGATAPLGLAMTRPEAFRILHFSVFRIPSFPCRSPQHTTDSLAKLSTFHFRFSTLSHSLLFGIFI